MRAHLDEGAVAGAGGWRRPARTAPACAGWPPSGGIERRCRRGTVDRGDDRDRRRAWAPNPASAVRNSGRIGSMIGLCDATSTSMRRASRFWALDHRDEGVDLLGWSGDHGLSRRGVDGDGHLWVVGDQCLCAVGVQFQQRHRALPGQSRHQPRPRRDHAKPFGRRQSACHDRRGDLPHRMSDDRVGFHPVGTPQRRQRQLHADQHRLNPLDPGHRFATGEAPPAAKTRSGQRRPVPVRRPRRRTPAHR